MPTGYTATLHDGEQTFEEYALGVARAFGALITMRDEGPDAPIPDEFPPDSYHLNALTTAKRDVTRYTEASDTDLSREQQDKRSKAISYRDDYVREVETRRQRYEAMLEKARAYKAPTPDHEGFAAMLVSQIQESIKFDCGDYEPSVPDVLPVEEYRAEKIARAQAEIARHEAEYAKDVQRAADRSAWVRALRESLGSVHA